MSVSSGNMPSVAKLEEIIIAANKALRGKLWREAAILFDRATKLKPQFVEGWLGKASAQTGTGDFRGAMESYRKALEVDAGSKEAWCGLIDTLHELGLYEEEVEACECLLRLSPRFDEILLNKGVAFHSLGRLDKALECFEQVTERRPENVSALNNKGAVLMRMGRLQEALDAFETALVLTPDNEDVQRNRCLLLLRLGRFGAAVMAADEMLKAKEEGWLLMLKGLAHVELREMPLAIQSLELAKELSPELEGIDDALQKARSLQEAMKESQAKAKAETDEAATAVPEQGKSAMPPQALGMILYNLGYPSESLRVWRDCMREENPYDWLAVGRAMMAGGERLNGERCMSEARRLGAGLISESLTASELPSVWREVARRSSEGYADDAIGILDRILKEKPDLEKAWRWLGVLNAMEGRYSSAEAAFRQVTELESGSPTALSNLGAVLICSGKIQEASEVLRRAFKIDSNHPEVLHNLAFVESKLGRNEEARELLRMALKVEQRPATLILLGSVLENMNRFREASDCYEKCLVLQAKNRMAMTGIARTRAKLQSRRKVSKVTSKALTAKVEKHGAQKTKTGQKQAAEPKRAPAGGHPSRVKRTSPAQSKSKGKPLGK